MGFIIFNRPKPKQFSITPRYYNEVDENKARRERMAERATSNSEEFNPDDFRAEFRNRINRSRESNSYFNNHYSSVRRMLVLMLITATIIITIYFIGAKYMV